MNVDRVCVDDGIARMQSSWLLQHHATQASATSKPPRHPSLRDTMLKTVGSLSQTLNGLLDGEYSMLTRMLYVLVLFGGGIYSVLAILRTLEEAEAVAEQGAVGGDETDDAQEQTPTETTETTATSEATVRKRAAQAEK
eukprot:CAMPEP_0204134456 /NCGR_PEP_ID=MMETSP0361-20130328/15679_1 /ASSEMBLY_ACC=CAM_ASM_000343 /TAXON_ID=268821 /ORGANISM="Scrippsiella Hangoei, Strain SHTV-5" /LENGTH=138 /DNA_ID=CAMNT_0051087653 /DNA_START=12 /DNA_END=428 /DNA_ORIENTATION=-